MDELSVKWATTILQCIIIILILYSSSLWDVPDNQEIIDKASVFEREQEEIKERMIMLAASTNDTKTGPDVLLVSWHSIHLL